MVVETSRPSGAFENSSKCVSSGGDCDSIGAYLARGQVAAQLLAALVQIAHLRAVVGGR